MRQNEAFHGLHADQHRQAIDVQSLASSLEHANCTQPDMDRFVAEDTLDQVVACYYTVLSYFIDAVTKQVIEREVVKKIPDVLSTQWVSGLDDDGLLALADEPERVRNERKQLEQTVKRMEFGLEAFRTDLAGYY